MLGYDVEMNKECSQLRGARKKTAMIRGVGVYDGRYPVIVVMIVVIVTVEIRDWPTKVVSKTDMLRSSCILRLLNNAGTACIPMFFLRFLTRERTSLLTLSSQPIFATDFEHERNGP